MKDRRVCIAVRMNVIHPRQMEAWFYVFNHEVNLILAINSFLPRNLTPNYYLAPDTPAHAFFHFSTHRPTRKLFASFFSFHRPV